jgi:5-oxoprolinase (ATP-hydrolysing)
LTSKSQGRYAFLCGDIFQDSQYSPTPPFRPDVVYETVIEVDERVCVLDSVTANDSTAAEQWASRLGYMEAALGDKLPRALGVTGEEVIILKTPDQDAVRRDLRRVFDSGVRSLAVALAHSYMYPEHEAIVGRIAEEVGFTHVSLSARLMPMVKLVPRAFTACADAYLTPCIRSYIRTFCAGFASPLTPRQLQFMQSDGGLASIDRFCGYRAVLSGPAGGVVGYATTTPREPGSEGVIGFDMGGTSTDVSRFDGHFDHVFENTTAGVTIQAPQLDINTVAAGGGSILTFRAGMFVVGPESAGARPGPACYRLGGPLTVTDANLLLGRILPEHFPSIFGPQQNQPLDLSASRDKMLLLVDQINASLMQAHRADNGDESPFQALTLQQVALGYVTVANEAMCRPIRALTQVCSEGLSLFFD